MEKGIENFFDYYKATFRIEHNNPESYSPLALAYIGDSIFDLMIRTIVVSKTNKQTQKYHEEVTKIVCATSQAIMMKGIKENLTEAEHAIYKRGRNANTNTKAKNASLSDYRNATAFEAVLGYLYLNEDFIRLSDIVRMSLDVLYNKDREDENRGNNNGEQDNDKVQNEEADKFFDKNDDETDNDWNIEDSDKFEDDTENSDVPVDEMEVADMEKDHSEWEMAEEDKPFSVIDGGANMTGYEADGSGD